MANDEVRPALSAEEWREIVTGRLYPLEIVVREGVAEVHNDCCGCSLPDALSTAALCLYGQPFGFTRDHVEALQRVLWNDASQEDLLLAEDAVALIAALLPPEAK